MIDKNFKSRKKMLAQIEAEGLFTRPSQILKWAYENKIKKIKNYRTNNRNGYCVIGLICQYLNANNENGYMLGSELRLFDMYVEELLIELNNRKKSKNFLKLGEFLESTFYLSPLRNI